MNSNRADPFGGARGPQPTGSVLVAFKPHVDTQKAVDVLLKHGITAEAPRSPAPFPGQAGVAAAAEPRSPHIEATENGRAFVFPRLNVAVIPGSATKDIGAAVASTLSQDDSVLVARPEFYMFAIGNPRYDAWVREGLQILIGGMASDALAPPGAADLGVPLQNFADTSETTWGIRAVAADRSQMTGKGIRVAVLDSGFDMGFNFPRGPGDAFNGGVRHPDFSGRNFVFGNFTDNSQPNLVTDHFGHGTHCIGTAVGPARGASHPKYGVAAEADLYVGKVLNDQGAGRERDIVAGMEWAIDQQCAVISLSLGRPVQIGEAPDPLYEGVGQHALDQGCLIVAAAGNDSFRSSNFIAPVSAPGNSSTIMAVAAIDTFLHVASFSNGGVSGNGGEVDIAGPGVSVFSSFPRPQLYKTLMGTSMAIPHVAGVAMLWAQSDPRLRGKALWQALTSSALELGLPQRDVGSGLVQAPVSPAQPMA